MEDPVLDLYYMRSRQIRGFHFLLRWPLQSEGLSSLNVISFRGAVT